MHAKSPRPNLPVAAPAALYRSALRIVDRRSASKSRKLHREAVAFSWNNLCSNCFSGGRPTSVQRSYAATALFAGVKSNSMSALNVSVALARGEDECASAVGYVEVIATYASRSVGIEKHFGAVR